MHLTTDNTAQCGTFSLSISARSDRYHHLETEEEEDDTNDEDFNVEMRQFSSSSHRFSKVSCVSLFFPHSLIHVVQNCSDEKSPDPSVCSKKKWQTMASTVSAIELSSKIYTHLLFLEGYAFCRSGNIAHNKYSCISLFSGMQSFGALQYQLLPESDDGCVI